MTDGKETLVAESILAERDKALEKRDELIAGMEALQGSLDMARHERELAEHQRDKLAAKLEYVEYELEVVTVERDRVIEQLNQAIAFDAVARLDRLDTASQRVERYRAEGELAMLRVDVAQFDQRRASLRARGHLDDATYLLLSYLRTGRDDQLQAWLTRGQEETS